MKWIYALFKLDHVHCYSDKVRDYPTLDGKRLITMACNKCGLEQDHIIQGVDGMDRNMYLLKKAQAELFERQFILARDSLIDIHSELLGGNIYDEVELRKLLDKIEVHLEAIGVTK